MHDQQYGARPRPKTGAIGNHPRDRAVDQFLDVLARLIAQHHLQVTRAQPQAGKPSRRQGTAVGSESALTAT
jgi:hypothetical protein